MWLYFVDVETCDVVTEANIIYTLHDDEWFRILSLHLNKDIKMIYHVLCGMIVNNNYVVWFVED